MILNASIAFVKTNAAQLSSIDLVNNGVISGAVTKLKVTFPCKVRLYERSSGKLIDAVQTDNNGFYKFEGLAKGFEYTVIAFDRTKEHNAVIQDLVRAK